MAMDQICVFLVLLIILFIPHIAMWGFCFSCSIPPPPPPPPPHPQHTINHQHNIISPPTHQHINTSTHQRINASSPSSSSSSPATQHHPHNIMHQHINTSSSSSPSSSSSSSSTQHNPHNIIHHHQHNTLHTPSSHHHQHNTIHTTSSTQHRHQHTTYTINTSSSTHHHQHIIINTSSSTQHHLHNTINTSSSTPRTQHHLHDIIINRRFVLRGKRSIWSTSREVCGTWSTSVSFAWQVVSFCVEVQHLEHHPHNTIYTTSSDTPSSTQHHLHNTINTSSSTPRTQHHLHDIIINRRFVLRGKRSIWSTSREVCGTWSTSVSFAWQVVSFCVEVQHLEHHPHNTIYTTSSDTPSSTQHHLHNTINTSSSTPRTQHHLHDIIINRRFVLRGKRSIWSTSREVCGTWSTSVSFAWQVVSFCVEVQHLEHHPHNTIYTTSSDTPSSTQHHLHNTINTSSPTPRTQHHLHDIIINRRFVLRGKRSIWSTSREVCGTWSTSVSFAWQVVSFCVEVQHLEHHPHNTIYTTSSDTPSSTQHHLHNTIHTTSSHTGRCTTWSTAILPLLPLSCWYPCCYSSLWIVLCSVSLTYSTVGCPKIVNMWGYPVL